MDYKSTIEFESKVAPGVIFILRRMSHTRRIMLNLKAAATFTKINELSTALEPIKEEIERAEAAARLEPCTCSHEDHDSETKRCTVKGCECRLPRPSEEIGGYTAFAKAQADVFQELINSLYPAYIRWGLAEVQGLNIDGKPATAESILDAGDERLVAELGSEIQRLIRLGPDETLGFKQPTTSGAAVEGQTSTDPSTALPANGASGTSAATASATSPA